MENEKEYPLWVRLGLWGVNKRSTVKLTAVLLFIFSVIELTYGLSLMNREIGMESKKIAFGTLLLIGFIQYFLTLRWMDKNGNWEEVDLHRLTLKESVISTVITIGGLVLIFALSRLIN